MQHKFDFFVKIALSDAKRKKQGAPLVRGTLWDRLDLENRRNEGCYVGVAKEHCPS